MNYFQTLRARKSQQFVVTSVTPRVTFANSISTKVSFFFGGDTYRPLATETVLTWRPNQRSSDLGYNLKFSELRKYSKSFNEFFTICLYNFRSDPQCCMNFVWVFIIVTWKVMLFQYLILHSFTHVMK